MKVLCYLELAPLTYQQLHKLSSINKNILRRRLDELVAGGALITHRYAIPYNKKFYGYTYKHSYCPEPPSARIYYLLNVFNKDVEEALENYHNQMRNSFDSVSLASRRNDALRIIQKKSDNKLDDFILLHIKNREIEWLELPLIEGRFLDDIKKLTERLVYLADFVLAHKFSILDLIIKCSHEPTILTDIQLHMYRYRDILDLLLETKFGNELRLKYAILSN